MIEQQFKTIQKHINDLIKMYPSYETYRAQHLLEHLRNCMYWESQYKLYRTQR